MLFVLASLCPVVLPGDGSFKICSDLSESNKSNLNVQFTWSESWKQIELELVAGIN